MGNTVYGAVSMTTVKETQPWKTLSNKLSEANVSPDLFNEILELSLKYLGWDEQQDKYQKEDNVYVRSNSCPTLLYKTSVYRFPVKRNCAFKHVYLNGDILHIGKEDYEADNLVLLAEFGNEEQPPTEDCTLTWTDSEE